MVNISKQTLQLFFGVFLSVFVLAQSVQVTQVANNSEQTDQNDSEEEGSKTETSVLQAQAINNTSSPISLGFDSYLLEEVSFEEGKSTKNISRDLLVPKVHNAIRVLLRKIISPNAP